MYEYPSPLGYIDKNNMYAAQPKRCTIHQASDMPFTSTAILRKRNWSVDTFTIHICSIHQLAIKRSEAHL